MDTKEKIQAEALLALEKIEVDIGKAKAEMRELTEDEMNALEKTIYKQKEDGSGPEVDADGKLTITDLDLYFNLWIATTLMPKFTVEEVSKWPRSLRKKLLEKAKKVNGIEPIETIAKN